MRLYGKTFLFCCSILTTNEAWGQTSASSFTYAVRYDVMRRVTGTIAPDPDGSGNLRYYATRNSYDASGRLIKVEKGQLQDWQSDSVAPADWGASFTIFTRVETDYDAMSRKVSEKLFEGSAVSPSNVTQYSYYGDGLLECTAVRMNPDKFDSLPDSACSLTKTGSVGKYGQDRITRKEYDLAGNVTKIIKGYGTDDQQNYATYSYTSTGKPETVSDANGNVYRIEYDGFDRQEYWYFISKKKDGTEDKSDYERYSYDENGNKESLRRRDGRIINFEYDALNHLVKKVIPDGCAPDQVGDCAPLDTTLDVYYGYDIQGRQIYARYKDGSATSDGVSTSYNGFGEISSSTTRMDGQSRKLTYKYNVNGNRSQITFPDGQEFDQEYDGLDRLKSIKLGKDTLAEYTWNKQGLIEALSNGRAATTYGYDGADRLIKIDNLLKSHSVSDKYTYNPSGQVFSIEKDNAEYSFGSKYNISRNYTVNQKNQYIDAGPARFKYDINGNLIGDGTSTYAYDAENRLISASGGVRLRYDPLGRLWEISGPSGTTRLLYDGDRLVAEYDVNGDMLRRYVHGTGEDNPLIWYEGAHLGDRRALIADNQGSIVAVVDSEGNPIRINTYDEYGIPKSDNLGRFQYTGQAFLPELGMYHYKARIYSPTLGRFLQTDPIGYADQINLYAYVANDPVNGRDPTGQQSISNVEGGTSCSENPSMCAKDAEITINGRRDAPATSNVGILDGVASAAPAQIEQTWGQWLTGVACSLPALNFGGGVDAYAAAGGSVSGGLAFNPRNGQISVQFGIGVGLGIGGGAYGRIGGGTNGGIAKGQSAPNKIASAGVVVNAAAEVGVGASGSYQLIGSSPGDYQFSGARAGPEVTANVNIGASAGLNAPALYNLGCK